jgi:D-alanyl-lipoteichoic acid acyltransferase DltB (MBOAT superfamily)
MFHSLSLIDFLILCLRPRLGPTLQKVVAVGVLYFILAAIDGTFRIVAVSLILCICLNAIECLNCLIEKRRYR